MKGMLSNNKFLEQGNKRVLRWSLWLDGYDFDIEYKPGKDNCIVDLLKFWGFNCNLENECVPAMMGSPFYMSFSSLTPMVVVHAYPSSRRYYSSY
jgi:hypothetical protein